MNNKDAIVRPGLCAYFPRPACNCVLDLLSLLPRSSYHRVLRAQTYRIGNPGVVIATRGFWALVDNLLRLWYVLAPRFPERGVKPIWDTLLAGRHTLSTSGTSEILSQLWMIVQHP